MVQQAPYSCIFLDLSKKGKGLMGMDNRCGDFWGQGGVRELRSNRKNTTEVKYNKKITLRKYTSNNLNI